MKKFFTLVATVALAAAFTLAFAACGDSYDAEHTITVGASPEPHAQILEAVKEDLKEQGYKLVIKQFDDYILPNTALEEGELDANYFQHTPYLNTFNSDYTTHLVAVEKIHYEPFGVYGKNVSKESFAGEKTGRTILVPNDGSNLTRALFVLRDEGYITLADGITAESNLTVKDIVNANGNTVTPVLAETVATQLSESSDGTIAVINGNYALLAGLSVSKDALAVESAEGDAAQLYANVVAAKSGNENSEKIKALVNALTSKTAYDFINNEYNGAVLPVFSV